MNSTIKRSSSTSDWLVYPRPRPEAEYRLFCFPYAGGGVAAFRGWPEAFPHHIEVAIVQLPGRENRLQETPYTSLPVLVETLAELIQSELDRPYIFFGYSMGSAISFELSRYLAQPCEQHPCRLPEHLVLAACKAPQIPISNPIYALPDEAFIAELNRRYQAIPKFVLDNPELLAAILPTLKADFAVLETHSFQPGKPLSCPITVFGGQNDRAVSHHDLQAWRKQTDQAFSMIEMPGDHFFIHHQTKQLQHYLIDCFAKVKSKRL